MWNKVCYFLCLLILVLGSEYGWAAHIVGGELSYRCIGNNNYVITLKLYRDCNSGGAQYDNPTTITIFDNAGAVKKTIDIDFPGSKIIPNNTYNLCLTAPPNICVEEAVFTYNVFLPRLQGGYTLVYQRCCRNNTVLNIRNPESTGASYVATIPDPLDAACNNSPVFTAFPPTVVCVNEPLTFDHSAKDPDGDSLAYSFFNPFAGGNTTTIYPVPANPPPFPLVSFVGYTYTNPIGGIIPLTIDPKTGMMKGTPNTIGQFVVGVAVKEYRKGILLSTHYRDFQLNVVQCVRSTSVSFNLSQPVCRGKTINFTNTSTGGKNYHWDFGSTESNDTSNLFSPFFTYKKAGTYTVRLTLNKGMTCEASDSMKITVNPIPESKPASNAPVCAGDSVKLNTEKIEDATYKWSGPLGFSSEIQNPVIPKTTEQNSGNYSLVVSINGCSSAPGTTGVTVHPVPEVTASSNSPACIGHSIQLYANTIPGASFSWRNSKGFTSTLQNPVINNITLNDADIYTVTATANGCFGSPASTTVETLSSPPPPVLSNSSPICSGSPLLLGAEAVPEGTFNWTGPNNFSSSLQYPTIPVTTLSDSGAYSATVTVNGCSSQPSVTEAIIHFSPTPLFTVTPAVICPEQDAVFTYTGDGNSGNDFQWNYGAEVKTGIGPHKVSFKNPGMVAITLRVTAPQCPPGISSQLLRIDSIPAVDFTANDLGCAPLPVIFQNQTRNGQTYNWNFGDGNTSEAENPLHNYSPGTFSVKLVAVNETGCRDSIFKSGLIQVIPNPVASFGSYPPLTRTYEFSESDFQFTNYSKFAVRYSWFFGDGDSSQMISPKHTYRDTGNFTVTLVAYGDIGCADTVHSDLIRIVPNVNYYIPNAFTPNNDGVNDKFRVYGRSINTVHLTVFDRFGEKIFESEDMFSGWEGTYKGAALNTGVYIYRAQIETLTGEIITTKGDVLLIK